MNRLCENYREINLVNYDKDDVRDLSYWAWQAYDEISSLHYRLELANKLLARINDLAEEV